MSDDGSQASAPSATADGPSTASSDGGDARPDTDTGPWGLSFYLFVEPFSVGRMVVDLSEGGGPGAELLRRAGAVDVLSPVPRGMPLALPSGGADLLLCALGPADVSDDQRRGILFGEAKRVLRADGMCVVRVVAEVLESAAGAAGNLRAALADLVLEHFATVEIIEETPFRAMSYFAAGCDDLAVSEAVSRVGGKPSHLIALCTPAPHRTWELTESLLVPIGPADSTASSEGELAAWRGEVDRLTKLNLELSRERDDLRERQMIVEDRGERLNRTVAALRKDVERYLRQISDEAGARELLMLERDQLQRKLENTDERLDSTQREVDKHKAAAQALRKEVARLRAALGVSAGPSRGSD